MPVAASMPCRSRWRIAALAGAAALLCAGLGPAARAAPAAGVTAPPVMAVVSAGLDHHGCAVADGRLYCWGADNWGALGDGSTSGYSGAPVAVDTSGVLAGKTMTAVSVGDAGSACALDSAGAAYCWGRDLEGDLGDSGGSSVSGLPVAVYTGGALAGKTLTQISAGHGQVCALDSAGAAYCWGFDLYGQAGVGYKIDSTSPQAVDTRGVLAGKTLTQISAGRLHSCALDTGGAAYCWGNSANGELGDGPRTKPAFAPAAVDATGALAGKTLTQISAGDDLTCALDSEGAAYCWGDNIYGELGDGSTGGYADVPVAVDAGGALAGKTLVRISAGAGHACALDTAGRAYCWGTDISGELGDGTTAGSDVPVAVDTSGVLAGQAISQISAGGGRTCAVDTTSTIYCWGSDQKGQLGDASASGGHSDVPVTVAVQVPASVNAAPGYTTATVSWTAPVFRNHRTLTGYTATAAPGGQACTTSATVTTCTIYRLAGATSYQVTVAANTATEDSGSHIPVTVTPRGSGAISAGSSSCAVESGHAWCWGSNDHGQLGDAGTANRHVPAAVHSTGVLAGRHKILSQIASSTGDFSCAADTAGAAYCWGRNEDGQLGDATAGGFTDAPRSVDTQGLPAGKTLAQVVTGGSHACALDSAGAAYCWGANNKGQLGTGHSGGSASAPQPVDTRGVLAGKTLTQITAGGDHACALDTAGTAYCWGADTYGELGDGHAGGSSSVPVIVHASGGQAARVLTQITAGGDHTCALDAAGTAWCWGRNNDGQLGHPGTGQTADPLAVSTAGALDGKTLLQVTAGFYDTCALDTAGAAYCWGDNSDGQLGDQHTANAVVPARVDASGAIAGRALIQISSAVRHTCALAATRAIFCWGYNGDGDLGDNTTASSNVPVLAGPQPPTHVTATPDAFTAAVSWTAPTDLDGGTLTGYTATAEPGGQACTTTAATTCTIPGLDHATFTITVVAHTTAGDSGASTSATVTTTP
jgi:alpha-tubulin suppressor-like RCC1 family protein